MRDAGPGIRDPEPAFDPLGTEKQVGDEDAMGHGLSIRDGLVQSFGSAIRGRTHPDDRALVIVDLSAGSAGDTT